MFVSGQLVAEILGHRLRDQPRHGVGRATRREGHDDGDGPGGIGLRQGPPCGQGDQARRGGGASGEFEKQWIAENKTGGRKKFLAMRESQTNQQIETVGAELRKMMTFLRRNKESGVPEA